MPVTPPAPVSCAASAAPCWAPPPNTSAATAVTSARAARRLRARDPRNRPGRAPSLPSLHRETEVIPMLKRFLIAGGILLGIILVVGGVFGFRMYKMIQGFKSQKQISTVSEEAAK